MAGVTGDGSTGEAKAPTGGVLIHHLQPYKSIRRGRDRGLILWPQTELGLKRRATGKESLVPEWRGTERTTLGDSGFGRRPLPWWAASGSHGRSQDGPDTLASLHLAALTLEKSDSQNAGPTGAQDLGDRPQKPLGAEGTEVKGTPVRPS